MVSILERAFEEYVRSNYGDTVTETLSIRENLEAKLAIVISDIYKRNITNEEKEKEAKKLIQITALYHLKGNIEKRAKILSRHSKFEVEELVNEMFCTTSEYIKDLKIENNRIFSKSGKFMDDLIKYMSKPATNKIYDYVRNNLDEHLSAKEKLIKIIIKEAEGKYWSTDEEKIDFIINRVKGKKKNTAINKEDVKKVIYYGCILNLNSKSHNEDDNRELGDTIEDRRLDMSNTVMKKNIGSDDADDILKAYIFNKINEHVNETNTKIDNIDKKRQILKELYLHERYKEKLQQDIASKYGVSTQYLNQLKKELINDVIKPSLRERDCDVDKLVRK